MLDGSVKILKDVILVPKLSKNLISLSLFDSIGFKSKNVTSKIMKGALVITIAKLLNGLYIIEGLIVKDTMATNSNKINETILWCKRFDHINLMGLQQLCK